MITRLLGLFLLATTVGATEETTVTWVPETYSCDGATPITRESYVAIEAFVYQGEDVYQPNCTDPLPVPESFGEPVAVDLDEGLTVTLGVGIHRIRLRGYDVYGVATALSNALEVEVHDEPIQFTLPPPRAMFVPR